MGKGTMMVSRIRRSRTGSVALWMLVAVIGLLGAGCSKQRAELKLKTADANIQKAREWKAGEYEESKSAFETAESSARSARELIGAQQGSQALAQAAEAVRQSKDALNQARARYADDIVKAARRDVEVARINDGQNENAKLFEQAQQNLQKAEEAYSKQKYDRAIASAQQTRTAIDQLLASLKNTAVNRLEELERRLKDLEAAKAKEFLPNSIIKTNEAVNQIRAKVETDRDYKQAIILAGTAITDAEAAIIESKRRNSQQELQTLESKISEAIAEEAPIYAPDMLKTSQESFEEILRNYYENQFDTVLAAAEVLKPRVERLIIVTRIEATKDKISSVESAIRRFQDQDVEQYLPGRIKAMEDHLAQARDLFNNSDYDGAKEQASRALVEQERITAAFDALAERAIQDAEKAFSSARSTFDKMTQIFGGGPGQIVDQRIEAQRQSEAANLSARLDAAQRAIKDAIENRTAKEFKKAIEQARGAEGVSDAVVNGTFGIVAQHAVLKIQDEISQLERMGAATKVPQQLAQVKELVEQTQKLVTEKQNRDAAQMAAKTRAYVENVKQELARVAVNERDRADRLIRRLEGNTGGGGASVTPSGGTRRAAAAGEYPGGSDLNNKEAMLADALEASRVVTEPCVVAQVGVGATPLVDGYNGSAAPLDNRAVPAGSFMTSDKATNVRINPAPGAPTGATIGTRPEPVVVTRDTQGNASASRGAYEGPTGSGPFVALSAVQGGAAEEAASGGDAAPAPSADTAMALRAEVERVLADEMRIENIRRYEPAAIEQARQKLAESSQLLQSQDYMGALAAAEQAQRIILMAESNAARRAAIQNLKAASKSINLAEAAGSVMFAPAQITEAIRLYEQAQSFLDRGENLKALEASERAMVAADDARLYNVNKARDLAALSTRYGGWKASHPLLVEAERSASSAEKLLSRPETALQGQECAKLAVYQAQLALDHARDWTYQERIDNIYRALNTALRAGANYFNVNEVKRLVAEISEVREMYVTRNYDAVELRLRDIETGLARVIETTPLVLEQNLQEVTAKLNALVEARAEEYMAQEVDDVKTLMNRSVIDFRRKDFQSSYVNLKNAIALTDKIEERLQEQVYFDAVTELFAQLDAAFKDFDVVLGYDRAFMKKLVATPMGQTAAISLTGRMNPNEFRDTVTDIYLRAIHLKPPPAQEGTHQEVLVAIKFARAAALNFQKLYIMDQLSKPDAYDILDTAYNQFERAKKLRAEIQVKLIDPMARTKVIRADKIVNF
jgi:hypothetical protein